MNCIECKRKIKDFLNDSLNTKQTIEFVEHVKNCDECMDELSVDFLVDEGLKRLDTATSFNLDKELYEKLDKATSKAKFERRFTIVSIMVTIIGSFFLGLILSTFFSY